MSGITVWEPRRRPPVPSIVEVSFAEQPVSPCSRSPRRPKSRAPRGVGARPRASSECRANTRPLKRDSLSPRSVASPKPLPQALSRSSDLTSDTQVSSRAPWADEDHTMWQFAPGRGERARSSAACGAFSRAACPAGVRWRSTSTISASRVGSSSSASSTSELSSAA